MADWLNEYEQDKETEEKWAPDEATEEIEAQEDAYFFRIRAYKDGLWSEGLPLHLTVEAADVDIISEDIPGWLVGNEGNLTVALDITLTDDLRNEGMARELVNRIQNIRKKSGLEITDRIRVQIEPNEAATKAVEAFGDYIARQVLADEIKLESNEGQSVEFDEFKLNINITKS